MSFFDIKLFMVFRIPSQKYFILFLVNFKKTVFLSDLRLKSILKKDKEKSKTKKEVRSKKRGKEK